MSEMPHALQKLQRPRNQVSRKERIKDNVLHRITPLAELSELSIHEDGEKSVRHFQKCLRAIYTTTHRSA